MKNEKPSNLDSTFGFIRNELVRKKLMDSKPRIERAFEELFSGYNKRAQDILNEVVRVKQYSGIVRVENISFYTYCEHHFAPFFGSCDVYYQPRNIITGLGKIVRLVRDVHARRLQIQEIMTKDIAEDLQRVLRTRGVFVRTRAKHLCICSRGPKDDLTETVVEYGLGTLSHGRIQ